ncbi:hypothetical protein FRC10_002335 [Ceratobasidium sp. 414]|nr:hypothetical protein FRC10_002335 [Ceratobasidium sp. 414]
MSASTSTLRALKLWLLNPQDAQRIVSKHGATLECLTVYAPPEWPRNFLVTWFDHIRYFVNLQTFTLGNLLRVRPELLDIVSKQKLRHLEFVHDPNMLFEEIKFLKDCPLLVRVTYHYISRVPGLDSLPMTQKIEVVYRRWNRVKADSDPYPDHLVLGENLDYSSWKDIASPQPLPLPTMAPRRKADYPFADQ